jgi:hypothetical protein
VVTAEGAELELELELELPVSEEEEEELEPESEPLLSELDELEVVEVVFVVPDVVEVFAAVVLRAGSCPVASCAKITPHTPRKTPSAPPMILRRIRRIRPRRSVSRR